jgi:Cytochrome b5-like Heme/Steroid binding domain/Bacterial Ig-like domain (group 2)
MKKTLFASLLCILTLSIPSVAQLANYTLADVAKHKTQTDCWIILNTTKVYNVSAYISLHPGGTNAIASLCGADATAAFNAVGHNATAVALEATYLIGNLVASPIAVTISPTTISLTAGQQHTFVANVSNSTMGVKWSATSVGNINQTGQYTAVTPGTGTVTATSAEDATKSATAQVTVTSMPSTGGVSVTISPTNSSVAVGGTQQFTANVTGSGAGAIWTATGSVGTVDSNGMFTATKAGQGIVKATAVDDSTKSASAAVTVTQTGAACSLASSQSGFNINCVPASMVPANRYSCVATSDGKSTIVRCTTGRGGDGGGDHGNRGGHDD